MSESVPITSTGKNDLVPYLDDPELLPILKSRFRGIRKQLKRCWDEHQGTCQARLHLGPSDTDIYVIDVQKMCLVKRKISETGYLTVSYVWGSVPQYHLTRTRLESLCTEGGITKVLNLIPRVIRESMDVARLLRARYLWVDSLCIVQDDADAKHHQIMSMAHIYNGSFLTIIAPEAVDSNSKLPCLEMFKTRMDYVRSGAKRPPCTYRGLASHLNSSKYGRRAWPYQERLLSWRCLYSFTDQIVLRCSRRIWYCGLFNGEEILDPLDRLLNFPAGLDPTKDIGTRFRYATMVQQYSYKELTYESDISAAFAGIANVLENWHDCDFRFGIPQGPGHLMHALMWFPDISPKNNNGMRRRLAGEFPSWSWMGWAGPVWFPILRQSYPAFEGQTLLDSVSAGQEDMLKWEEMSRDFGKQGRQLSQPTNGRILRLDVDSISLDAVESLGTHGPFNQPKFVLGTSRNIDTLPFHLTPRRDCAGAWVMRQTKYISRDDNSMELPKEVEEVVGIIYGVTSDDLSAMASIGEKLDILILSTSTTIWDMSHFSGFDSIFGFNRVEVANFILIRWLGKDLAERVAAGRMLSSTLNTCKVRRKILSLT